jgi:hypothetical protein
MSAQLCRCNECAAWEVAETDAKRGRCMLNPPHVEMVPIQTLQGQGLSAVAVYPETRAKDGCMKGVKTCETPTSLLKN